MPLSPSEPLLSFITPDGFFCFPRDHPSSYPFSLAQDNPSVCFPPGKVFPNSSKLFFVRGPSSHLLFFSLFPPLSDGNPVLRFSSFFSTFSLFPLFDEKIYDSLTGREGESPFAFCASYCRDSLHTVPPPPHISC